MASFLSPPDPGLPPKSIDQIIAEMALLTNEQRSLAWSPMPPPEPMGAHDCRVGGSCGLDFNHETRRSRWIQARFRFLKEQKRLAAMAHRDVLLEQAQLYSLGRNQPSTGESLAVTAIWNALDCFAGRAR